MRPDAVLGPDGYRLRRAGSVVLVEGGDARGALHGSFALLRDIAEEHLFPALDENSQPQAPVRWTDDTIERGYGGRSIFFEKGQESLNFVTTERK